METEELLNGKPEDGNANAGEDATTSGVIRSDDDDDARKGNFFRNGPGLLIVVIVILVALFAVPFALFMAGVIDKFTLSAIILPVTAAVLIAYVAVDRKKKL